MPPSIPHLTRSSLHRRLQRHGQPGGDQPKKQKFATYPIGDFHIAIAEGQTEEGKLDMFVTVDRPAKFAYAALHPHATRMSCKSLDLTHRTLSDFAIHLPADIIGAADSPLSRTRALLAPAEPVP